MTGATADPYRPVAEASWRWVLDQVQYDDGPWIPASGAPDAAAEPPWDRDGTHSGIGGLAQVLAEVRLVREWTTEERALAEAVGDRVRSQIGTQTDATLFDGLTSTIGVLLALGDESGPELAVSRLLELADAEGWALTTLTGPRYRDGVRVNDLTLGTAGVLAGALWAGRYGVPGARELAEHAAAVLLAESEPVPTGVNWSFVPQRFLVEPPGAQMPNLSHGLAGIASMLALAGAELGRPDLVDAAALGAAHLVHLGDTAEGGFVVPRMIPGKEDLDEVTFTWCHGPTGTSLLFRALQHAGVAAVAGATPESWHRRCLHSVRTSGVPARLRPGFWDNDGRCCGTAGVGEVFLDSWHHSGDPDDLAFARMLADTLVERAVREGDRAYWRFLEHRNDPPLLPPGVGWMQGAAGIAAFLFHVGRVAEGRPSYVPRMDTWWSLPVG